MVADAEYPQAASTVAQKLIQRSRLLVGCLLSLLTARNLNLEHGVLNYPGVEKRVRWSNLSVLLSRGYTG